MLVPSGPGSSSQPPRWPAALGLSLLAIASLGPLLLAQRPARILDPLPTLDMRVATIAAAFALLLLALAVRAWLDRRSEKHPLLQMAAFACLGFLMALYHLVTVDARSVRVPPGEEEQRGYKFYPVEGWQRLHYEAILTRQRDELGGLSFVPHVFRPLPYGFTRSLELLTHDWIFSCFAYRWFFTTWFLWASFHLARRFLWSGRSWLVVAVVVFLYPFSTWYYWGQLTDPLSHFLFVLGMIYIVEDRWLGLLAALGLGIWAKETALLLVPAYWLLYCRQGLAAWLKSFALGAGSVAAYLAARVPLGWRLSFATINATTGWMIRANFIGDRIYTSPAPIYQNYLFPIAFVGVFIPRIVSRWHWIDARLKPLFLMLTPLLLITNACFGWMHEARNYLPLVPLLATMALTPRRYRQPLPATVPQPRSENAAIPSSCTG